MSGGHFEYVQYRIDEVANDLKNEIDSIGKVDQWGDFTDYTKETQEKFEECEALLRKAGVMLQRIDWLISGDDGEETFHERLDADLKELQNG